MHESPTFLSIGSYAAECGRDFPRHTHEYWELVYYTRGPVRAIVGERAVDAGPGVLVATPPGTPHEEIAVAAYANIYLAVDAPAEHGWPLASHDDSGGRLGRIFRDLVEESREPDSEMIPALTSELDILLRRARERPIARGSAADLVSRAESIMAQNLTGAPTLARIAEQLGVVPSTLRLAFIKVHGIPPSTQLAQIRVRSALAHLRTSSLTLESVARLTGYASASHLTRHVKQATGLTPGAVRRSVA